MTIKKDSIRTIKLLDIAARVEALVVDAEYATKAYLNAGRLARDPHDVGALSESIVEDTKRGGPITSMLKATPVGELFLLFSLEQVSMNLWEQMWNNAHPDQFGQGWEGGDFALMSVWRKQVRAMIAECGQEAILSMSFEEFCERMNEYGASEEDIDSLAEWISEICAGDTPST